LDIYSGGTYEPLRGKLKAADEGQAGHPYPPRSITKAAGPHARTGGQRKFRPQDSTGIYTQVRLRASSWCRKPSAAGRKSALAHGPFGYTGSVAAQAFNDAVEQGKVHSGDLVTFVGSGVGYNQAGSAFRMP